MSYTKDKSVYVLTKDAFENVTSPNNSAFQQYDRLTTKLLRSRTGDRLPGWKDIIQKQQNATTNMSGTFDTYWAEYGECWCLVKNQNNSQDAKVYKDSTYGNLFGNCTNLDLYDPSISSSKALNRALISYLKKIREVQVSFSGPTFLGELGEAIHMIRHPAKGLRGLADAWLDRCRKTKKWKRPAEWKQNLSGMWLEQAFGWKPLISDIQNAYNTYKGLANKEDSVMVTGTGIDEQMGPVNLQQVNSQTSWGRMSHRFTKKATEKCVVKFHGKVIRRTEAPIRDSLQSFGFFDLDEWKPTAWELLPWSFLVDYFSNIGDVITASVANRSRIVFSNSTVISTVTYRGNYWVTQEDNAASHATFIRCGATPLSAEAKRRKVVRTANVAVGYPDLAFELPTQPAQWANMLALAVQVHNGIHPQKYIERHA
jgi:hypothetical protein